MPVPIDIAMNIAIGVAITHNTISKVNITCLTMKMRRHISILFMSNIYNNIFNFYKTNHKVCFINVNCEY